jgi:hypothetical protein
MPMTRENTRHFHKHLYGPGILETVTLLKRRNDQDSSTVTAYELRDCRQSRSTKHGNAIQGGMSADHFTVWHIPGIELERIGISIHEINVLDRIVDNKGFHWQPEHDQVITVKMLGNHSCLSCIRVDPPEEDA